MDFKTGGQKVIERLVEAYGFTTRQALCDHLGVSKSTLATRYMRDLFPAEWVVQCALETGVELKWLTSGDGMKFNDMVVDLIEITKKKFIDGKLVSAGYYLFDKTFLPLSYIEPRAIIDRDKVYIVEDKFEKLTDGMWLVEIEGKVSIKEILRIPVNRIRVMGDNPFECNTEDINILSKVLGVFSYIE